MIIIDRSGQSAITVVLPGARSSFIVRYDDDVEIAGRHIDDVLRAQVTDTFQIAPSSVGMKITNQRQVRQIRQKLFHPPRGASVFLDTTMTPIRSLVRERMFDDINVRMIAISEQQSETFSLVDFNRRDQQCPKRI